MAKLFCVSDIHGFFDEFKKALDESGFDENNPEHWLIVCGDCFDRGSKPLEVMNYLMGIERSIIVKGNHEILLLNCIQRRYPCSHDWHNGTADTIIIFGGDIKDFGRDCAITYEKVKDFIYSMPNYFETKKYVFVHGWFPIKEDWRNANQNEWDDAMWRNGMEMAMYSGIENKTIVCGHYHTSFGHHIQDGSPEFGEGADFSPYYGDGIIAIDACTAYSGKVNVLVLEDEFLDEEF